MCWVCLNEAIEPMCTLDMYIIVFLMFVGVVKLFLSTFVLVHLFTKNLLRKIYQTNSTLTIPRMQLYRLHSGPFWSKRLPHSKCERWKIVERQCANFMPLAKWSKKNNETDWLFWYFVLWCSSRSIYTAVGCVRSIDWMSASNEESKSLMVV